MKFTLSRPSGRVLDWLLPWVFEERLGLCIDYTVSTAQEISLKLQDGSDNKIFLFPSNVEQKMAAWAASSGDEQLPDTQLFVNPLNTDVASALPVFADAQPNALATADKTAMNFDPLTLIAAMLSGVEEVLDTDRDEHDRFRAAQSISTREGWLDRPVVDETINALTVLINALWPKAVTLPTGGRMLVSCDVDQPFSPDLRNPYSLVRSVGGDLKNRKDIRLAVRRIVNGILAPFGTTAFDTSYTFDRYMRTLEDNGLRGQFFIISGHSGGAVDGFYHLHQGRIRKLLAWMNERGHFLGNHSSYNTFRDQEQFAKEKENLSDTLGIIDAELGGSNTGNRQHFLRWDMQCTPDHLDAAGFEFDTSGSYPDAAGFRYGTSHSFPMWSWPQMQSLTLRQQPLIAMECSVIAPRYMGLGYSQQAYAVFEDLQNKAMRGGGTFTLLWHNSHFVNKADWALFEHLVKRGAQIESNAAGVI